MAFKLDENMGGTGTINEYFSAETWANASGLDVSDLDPALQAMQADTDDRNKGIDDLQRELFSTMVGLTGNEPIKVIWPENGYYSEEDYKINVRRLRNARRRKGLILIGWQMDDPIMGLFRDGAPIAGFYASYRGIYQAGAYVVATGKSYFASDFAEEPHNTWLERDATCADIARDFILGNHKY